MDDRRELLYIGAELPRHPTGKLLKRVLRDEYAVASARNEQEISR